MHVIPLLSLVWFGLCTALVTREANLIIVFYSFVQSFLLAYAFIGVGALFDALPSTLQINGKLKMKFYNSRMIKNTVTVLVSLMVLLLILLSDDAIGITSHMRQAVSSKRFSIELLDLLPSL